DLDDLATQVGEEACAPRPRQGSGEVEDADTAEEVGGARPVDGCHYTTPSARSAATLSASRPRSSSRTAWVCWPHDGDGSSRHSSPPTRNGMPGASYRPSTGWSTVRMKPRSR